MNDQCFDRPKYPNLTIQTLFSIVIGFFTGLAIIIAFLGVFALSSFMITGRTKEIGIRKSMRASVQTIYSMLSWNFLKWILISMVMATPVAWILMRMWLETFCLPHFPGADIFIMAGLGAIAIALGRVTVQSLKQHEATRSIL